MKNTIRQISILMLLITAGSFACYSQTQSSKTVGKNETVSFLIAENKLAREVIEKQEKYIADLESEVELEREKSDSLSKSYEAAKGEIESLRQSNDALTRAVFLNEQTIELLKDDNAKQKEKARKAQKAKYRAFLIAAGAVALKFLIP